MTFLQLRAIKRMVSLLKTVFPYEEIQFEKPHMYADGKWACSINLGKVPDGKLVTALCTNLRDFAVYYWFGAGSHCVVVHIQ